MLVENQATEHLARENCRLPYAGEDVRRLINEYGIHSNAVITFLGNT